MARHIVSNLDDIVYKFREDATTLEDEFAPPKAEYIMIEDAPNSGNMIPAKRQTQGEFSWMAFIRPENNPFSQYSYATLRHGPGCLTSTPRSW